MKQIRRLKAEDLVEPQMSANERMGKRQYWPKSQEATPTPDSHGFVAQAYEDALVLEAMPSRFRGMASVFGLFMLAVFAQVASRLSMIVAVTASGAAKGDYWVVFLGVLLLSFMLALMLLTLVSAVRIFRIDLLAPKQIPMVFNRRTRKVYRYAQDIPGFEELAGPDGKFSWRGVLRYIASTFRPWPNMILVEYDWDCLEAEYYSVTALAGNVVRTDHHVELFVREHPGSDKVIGSFALIPSILANEQTGREVWEHIRRFMQAHGPALNPGERPAKLPRGFWQALNASTGLAWVLFVAAIVWTWSDVYWFALSLMGGIVDQQLWEQALRHPIPGLHKVFAVFFSYFGMGWVVFNVLSHYLSREGALPKDVMRDCGARVI